MPGKNATGTNTAPSTSAVAMTAPVTSPIAADAASRAGQVMLVDVPLDVLDHDDRVVHHEARGERDAEERQRVDREAEQLHERERADERHRNRDRRNQRRAPVLQEQEHDEDDEADRLEQRRHDLANRLGDDRRRVERELDLQPRRKPLRQPIELRA